MVGTEVTVHEVMPDGFTIKQMGKVVKVFGMAESVSPNEYVYLQAVFHKGPWLDLKKIHVAKYRRLKIVTSVVPVVFIFFLFFREYKFNFVKIEFSERH